ncbi:MAG: hypothetical protein ACFCUR_00905 [Rhodomicrobiaceae bacterium]
MENYYFDRMKANLTRFSETKRHFEKLINHRRCLIIGSAPEPVFPGSSSDDCILCVNGSVYSVYKHLSRGPDITYLNAAFFRDENIYTSKTRAILAGKHIGDALVAWRDHEEGVKMLEQFGVDFGIARLFSKYEKRLILTEVLAHNVIGLYAHRANVSNGILMVAFALACGAREAILIGFSFDHAHAYSPSQQLSPRAHAEEDTLFLRLALSRKLPLTTTSQDLHSRTGLPLTDLETEPTQDLTP